MHRTQWNARLALLLFAGMVSACGGGGGTSAGATVSGKVIDGYIRGATVFWDCNANYVLDAGEVSTTTTAGGNYTLAAAPSAACSLMAEVGATAVDESSTATTGRSYTMQAVPGRSDLITPYSTLIAGRLSTEQGLTVTQAESQLASLIGATGGKVLVDYVAQTVSPDATILATTAKVLATSLHANQGGALFTAGVTQTYTDISNQFAKAGYAQAISRGLEPFTSSFKSISERLAQLITGNPNNRLYRQVTYSDAAANTLLDGMAAEVNNRGATAYGVVNWGAFTNDELKAYLVQVHRINALPSDATAMAAMQAFQSRRTAVLSAAAARMNLSSGDDGNLVGTWRFFTSDPGASVDFVLDMASISIDTAIDVTTIGGTRPPIGRPSNYAQKHKSLNAMLDNLAFIASAVKCQKASADINDSETGMLTKVATLVGECGGFFADVAADAAKVAKTRKATEVASAAITGVGGWGAAVDDKSQALMALHLYATTLGLVHDVVEPFVKDPVTSRFLAAADLGIQYLNASAAGLALEIAASEKMDAAAQAAMTLYDQEVAAAMRTYYISNMQLVADFNFKIQDAVPPAAPVVAQAVLQTDGTVRVNGTALAGVGVRITWPNGVTSNVTALASDGSWSDTSIAISYMAGQRVLVSTTSSTGTSAAVSVAIVANVPAITVDIPATAFVRGVNVALIANGAGLDALGNAPPYLSAPNAADWDFTVPEAGTYELFAEYAAGLSRPVAIYFNGVLKFSNALSATTGGWLQGDRQVLSQGMVVLSAGATTMHVARSDVFPHIKGFTLVKVAP